MSVRLDVDLMQLAEMDSECVRACVLAGMCVCVCVRERERERARERERERERE